MILSETAGVQPWISRERNEKRMEKDYSAAMEFDWWMDPTGNCLLNALWYRVGSVGHNMWQPVSAWSKDQNISPKGRGKEFLKLHSDQKLILPVGGYQNHQNHQKYKDYAVSKSWYNPDNPHIAWLASQKPSQNFAKHLDESTRLANSAIVTRTDWRDLSWWAKASQKTRIQQSMTESRLCLWSGTPNSLTSLDLNPKILTAYDLANQDTLPQNDPCILTWNVAKNHPASIFFGQGCCIRDDTLSCSLDLFRASWPAHLPNRSTNFTKFGVSLQKIMVPKKKIHGVWCLFLVWDFQDKKNESVPMFSHTLDLLKVFCFQSSEKILRIFTNPHYLIWKIKLPSVFFSPLIELDEDRPGWEVSGSLPRCQDRKNGFVKHGECWRRDKQTMQKSDEVIGKQEKHKQIKNKKHVTVLWGFR